MQPALLQERQVIRLSWWVHASHLKALLAWHASVMHPFCLHAASPLPYKPLCILVLLCTAWSVLQDDDWGLTAYPLIPGHEVVGEVVAVGGDVRGVSIGSRVGVGWIRDSCRRCPNCLRGNENLCKKGYTGLIVGREWGCSRAVLLVFGRVSHAWTFLHQ